MGHGIPTLFVCGLIHYGLTHPHHPLESIKHVNMHATILWFLVLYYLGVQNQEGYIAMLLTPHKRGT
jgi:hypothetical protein